MYPWRGDPNLSIHSDRDYLSQVILHLTTEINNRPDCARSYFQRGNAYLDSGQFNEAIQDYSDAIDLDPSDPVLYNNRGIALRYMERFESAIEDYDRALSIDPRYRDALTNRGIAYADMGDLELAIQDFDRAIVLDPEFWFAYSQRGLARWGLGLRAEAEADYAMVRSLQSLVPCPDNDDICVKTPAPIRHSRARGNPSLGAVTNIVKTIWVLY